MGYETIDVRNEDGVQIIKLNRPDSLNALNDQLMVDLQTALDAAFAPDSGVRCLLLTGEGRGFSSGADLAQEAGGLSDPKRDLGAMLEKRYHPIIEGLHQSPIPVVTAVNGAAAGAGMSIALCGDIILAARSAYFLQAFVNIGLVPDAGSTYMLPRLVGRARAQAMMMLGQKLPAEKALEWGLIYDVVDDDKLMDVALEMAKKLAAGPTRAIGMIRRTVFETWDNDLPSQLKLERELQRDAGRTDDFMEGVSAFLQKRKAEFKGQ